MGPHKFIIYTKNNIEDLELYDCLDFEKIIDKSNCEDGLLQNVEKFESDNNYLYAIAEYDDINSFCEGFDEEKIKVIEKPTQEDIVIIKYKLK